MQNRLDRSSVPVVLLAAVLAAGTPAFADTVTLSNTPFDGDLPGGEFIATTGDYGTFTTFCLEHSESVSMGVAYNYALSNRAYNGSVGPEGDPISDGTAYLYTLFRTGGLAGYATTDAIHDVNAGWLQKAIWALEGEGGYGNEAANPYLSLAITRYGSFANAQADYTGTAVKVMNITTATGYRRQDQLIYVPDVAATLGLLGAALAGLIGLRRRVRA